MSLVLIAELHRDLSSGVIGYRLLDTDSKDIMNVPINSLIQNLSNHRAKVDNVEVVNGNLKGTNGSLDRYPKAIFNGSLIDPNKKPLIILNRVGDSKYTVCDYAGAIKILNELDVKNYASKYGIANGKLVPNGNDAIISAISGTYPFIPEPEPKSQPKPESFKPESILTDEQKLALDTYFKHYAIKNRDIYLSKVEECLRTNSLTSNYSKYKNVIYILNLIDELDKLLNLLDRVLAESLFRFLELKLPILADMNSVIEHEFKSNTKDWIGAMFSSYTGIVYLLSTNKYSDKLVPIVNTLSDSNSSFRELDWLDRYMENLNVVMLIVKELEEVMKRSNITYNDLINNYDKSDYGIAIILSHMDYDNAITLRDLNLGAFPIEDMIGSDILDRLGNLLAQIEPKTIQIDEPGQMQIDNPDQIQDLVSKPNNYTEFEWFRWLLDHNDVSNDNYCIKVTLDIMGRKLKYNKLTPRQKYQVDKAIKLCEEANNKRLGINKSSSETNESYSLSEHPDIKDKVERIVAKADSVEMQEVLKESPNVIKICYTILRYGKASTKQLRHVDLAIDILDRQ